MKRVVEGNGACVNGNSYGASAEIFKKSEDRTSLQMPMVASSEIWLRVSQDGTMRNKLPQSATFKAE
jgi:hypothetical protein